MTPPGTPSFRRGLSTLLIGVLLAGCGGGGSSGAADSGSSATLDGAPALCDTTTAAGLRGCVDPARYLADLEAIAQPRPPGSAHWQTVQDLCAERFEQLGYSVERQAYGTGVNVIGKKVGTTGNPVLLLSAHYDHIADCPGADDNATGLAATLEAARVLSTVTLAGTLLVACWDEEENGHLGSQAYAARLKANKTYISAMVGFEMIGYASSAPSSQTLPTTLETYFPDQAAQIRGNGMRGDFIAVVHDQLANPWAVMINEHAAAESLPIVSLEIPATMKSSTMAADLRRSDHASFWDVNIPGVMISDTADLRNPHYHCKGGPDVVADLDLGFADKVVRTIVGTAAGALGIR